MFSLINFCICVKLFILFSWDEIGLYDLPANIDYILAHTGAENLFYIGHSQGTTVYYVMASEKPEYNDKIRLAVLMGPAAYMENLDNPFLQLLALFQFNLEVIYKYLIMCR